MSNLIEIQTQIQRLQKQAEEIKGREFDATVLDILSKMAAFGITVKDLQASSSSKGRRRLATKTKTAAKVKVAGTKNKKSGMPVAAKYKGPNGEVWSGRGLMPRWMAALVAQGQAKESFAIQN